VDVAISLWKAKENLELTALKHLGSKVHNLDNVEQTQGHGRRLNEPGNMIHLPAGEAQHPSPAPIFDNPETFSPPKSAIQRWLSSD